MKPYISLKIAEHEIQLKDLDELPISLTYQLEDTEDFQKKKGSESFNITVPATPQNDRAFNTFHNPSIEDLTAGQVFRKPRPVRISAQGEELLNGKSFLISATHTDKPTNYKINCYGGNADWMIDMKELTLFEILRDVSFAWSLATIQNSWAWNSMYVFAPAKYGNWLDDQSSSDNNFGPATMKPSLSVYWIFYKAFKLFGYKINSGFFDTDFFRRLVMPWTWGNFLSSEGTKYEIHKFAAKSVGNFYGEATYGPLYINVKASNDSSDGMFDNNNTVPNGDYEWKPSNGFEMAWQYKTPHYGPLEVALSLDISIDCSATANSGNNLWIRWFKNGVQMAENHISHVQAPVVSVAGQRSTDIGIRSAFFSSLCQPNDTLSCRILAKSFGSKTGQSRQRVTVERFQLDYFRVPLGGTISFDSYNALKKVKFLDVFRGIIDAFNLSTGTNVANKEVLIETTHETKYGPGFFNNNFTDWNAKQDVSKESELELFSDYDREVTFKFKEDSNDGILKLIQDRNGNKLAASKYVLPERFKAGKKDFENRFFSPVMHYEADQFKDVTGIVPQFVVMVPENISNTSRSEAQNTFNPRLCYYKGDVTGVGGWKWNGANRASLPFMFAVNYKDGGENDPVLSYSDERIGSVGSEVVSPGLLKIFFWQRLAIMRNGQYYTTHFHLKNIDVNKPWHREHISLRNQKWELISISNYKPLQPQATECFLRKWAPIIAEDFNFTYPSVSSLINGNLDTSLFDIKYAQLKCLASDIPQPE